MPKLPCDAYNKLMIYLGYSKADEVFNKVENGERDPDDVVKWINQIAESREKAKHHRDIEPEEWRDFEDGWRPDD